jgi:AcrR family transcriptional regulator
VPKLWNDTIQTHRAAVRDAILDATATLVAGHGLASVTMSQVAEQTGIGRATLYKYFPSVEAILLAWHQRQVSDHLRQLTELRGHHHAGDPGRQLQEVLEAYALMRHQSHGGELAAMLHQGAHLAQAQRQLGEFLQTLLAEGVATGEVRDDVVPGELASYCLHALAAASSLPSKAAVHRLVAVTLAGLRPPS